MSFVLGRDGNSENAAAWWLWWQTPAGCGLFSSSIFRSSHFFFALISFMHTYSPNARWLFHCQPKLTLDNEYNLVLSNVIVLWSVCFDAPHKCWRGGWVAGCVGGCLLQQYLRKHHKIGEWGNRTLSDGKDWLLFDYVKRFRHFINLLNEAVIQCRVCVLRPGGVGEVRTFFTVCHTAVLKPFIFRQSLRFENVAEMSFIFWLLVGDRRDVERLKRDREECDWSVTKSQFQMLAFSLEQGGWQYSHHLISLKVQCF